MNKTDFIQLHILTGYPAANLNRDDLGRPKTTQFGGANRLRVSSQCLKRVARTARPEPVAIRTKTIGENFKRVMAESFGDKASDAAERLAEAVAGAIDAKAKKGKDDEPGKLLNSTLAFYSKAEFDGLVQLAASTTIDSDLGEALTKKKPTKASKKVIEDAIDETMDTVTRSADVAMFGRMFAANPKRNVDAAVQVSHAFTVHEAAIEDDFFTAVDDEKDADDSRGGGHMGETGFGSGVFYIYVCINRTELVKNLAELGDAAESTADEGIANLITALTTHSPSGKQNAFASRARALHVIAERGPSQPRSLAVAFLDPVTPDEGYVVGAINRMWATRGRFDAAYGDDLPEFCLDATGNRSGGNLAGLITFCTGGA